MKAEVAIAFVAVVVFSSVVSVRLSMSAAPQMPLDEVIRERRQTITDPQLNPGPAGVLAVPIPTNIAHFLGGSSVIGRCDRDEIESEEGSCQRLLTQGNCGATQVVLLDPQSNKGFCAPRLCPPDRIFVFSSQLCHDPKQLNICPPGRELYYSSYGTPVCQCPDGTYEGDDDLDDDVCEPLLGQIMACPAGQVFWFRDFSRPPECLPDPCKDINLKRGPNDLPFVPSKATGQCFMLGSSTGVCPPNQFYALELDQLAGECNSLEDSGYSVFDSEMLRFLMEVYGPPISGSRTEAIPDSAIPTLTSNIIPGSTKTIGQASISLAGSVHIPSVGSGQFHVSTSNVPLIMTNILQAANHSQLNRQQQSNINLLRGQSTLPGSGALLFTQPISSPASIHQVPASGGISVFAGLEGWVYLEFFLRPHPSWYNHHFVTLVSVLITTDGQRVNLQFSSRGSPPKQVHLFKAVHINLVQFLMLCFLSFIYCTVLLLSMQ